MLALRATTLTLIFRPLDLDVRCEAEPVLEHGAVRNVSRARVQIQNRRFVPLFSTTIAEERFVTRAKA